MAATDAPPALRVSIGEDDVLLREGIVRILSDAGLNVVAEGKSNLGVAQTLLISQAAVEKYVTAIFRKLAIAPASTEHRRVQAVLMFLRQQHSRP
jgi:DNA-binding CsgD family transcriptional regulator